MTAIMECSNSLKLELPANLDSIDWAEDRVEEFIRANKLEIDIFALKIMTREAMANAVIHGCGKNGDMTIQLELIIDDSDRVILKIKDSGNGFDWKTLMKYNDILADRGRGLPIMEIYSDQMYFNDKGNEVVLIKSCNSK